ncbi:bifunctional aspartate kinase/homoserine dehydrogenase I [Candidatus Palauibacter sp.]|uniref:bifunctional aspartate kinase/homoserine dehydrogenase I n=1 Tax=Candidatus Palauibacter sp. TaxID=3101350 RepID=UPI003B51AF4E
MKILKFGGSSLADAGRIRAAARVVIRQIDGSPRNGAVVVSAIGGLTDRLFALAAALDPARRAEAASAVRTVRAEHLRMGEEVADSGHRDALLARLGLLCDELAASVLAGAEAAGARGGRRAAATNRVVCHGELLSAELVAAALRTEDMPAEACDSRAFILTDLSFHAANVDFARTSTAVARYFGSLGPDAPLQVITGFLGSGPDGATTTLGRGGSDLSASLVGAAIGADRIEIWTDVPGVMTADPRRVENARPIGRLTYEELMELSHFGAKVVYPPTVAPARRHGIPMVVRNSLEPDRPGTLIENAGSSDRVRDTAVTGTTSIGDVHLLLLAGDGLIGAAGVAGRLFDALASCGASAILISQGSSEHSICLAVAPGLSEAVRRAIDAEFQPEIEDGSVRPTTIERDQAIIAVVGDGMRHRPGISGRVFGALGQAAVNVRAIARGSSERNISAVVARADLDLAVSCIHREFFGSPASERLAIFVLGVGGVGSAFLRQLSAARNAPGERGIDFELRAVSNSRHMHLAGGAGRELDPGAAHSPEGWRELLEEEGEAADPDRLLAHLGEAVAGGGRTVLVDLTASPRMGGVYRRAVALGAAVVSANKHPFAGPLEDFHALRAARERAVFHEATVGAGLPVLHTADLLLRAGDRIDVISGVFSGTLAYLTAELAAGTAWSEAIGRAHRLGYTEPDPRDDLGGMDVARKLLILARLCGFDLDLEDLDVRPMLDRPDLAGLPLEEFWRRLPETDGEMADRFAQARGGGRELAYLAELDVRGPAPAARVGLRAVPRDHPAAGLTATENMFIFRSRRYETHPVIVRGPGAGAEVTAAGVFGDVLRAHAERRVA